MNTPFNSLKNASIKLFCLKPKALIKTVSYHSLGLSFIPPIYARNLQLWSDNGAEPVQIHGKLMDFFFNTLPDHKLTNDVIEGIYELISDMRSRRGNPSVCVFLPRFAITKMIGLMSESESFSYWLGVTPSDTTKLYEFYFDEQSKIRARLTNHKSIFCPN